MSTSKVICCDNYSYNDFILASSLPPPYPGRSMEQHQVLERFGPAKKVKKNTAW
jgi:hypothetical protein